MLTQSSPSLLLTHKREASRSLLDRECVVFSKYLLGIKPTEYVMQKYHQAHEIGSVMAGRRSNLFDRLMTGFATISPVATRIADSYAALFLRNGLLRRKLIVLLAILESCAPSYSRLDSIDETRPLFIVLKMIKSVCASGVLLLIATLTFLPLHVLFGVTQTLFARAFTLWKEC
jgi:hypothetical protein